MALDYPFARRKRQLPGPRSATALLRVARPRDLDELVRIEEACFQEHRFRREYLDWIVHNRKALALVEDDGRRLIGACMIFFEARQSRVLSIAVLPEFRRRGLGTRMMQAVERASLERGCSMIRLEVATRNVTAIEFYRELGYETDGLLPRYYSWGEDAFSMRKSLLEAKDEVRAGRTPVPERPFA